jgi:hypothetical protein
MQRRRILLLRSGRHLDVAIEALVSRFPGCQIAVVGTRGSQPAIQQSGIAETDTFISLASRFQPLSFVVSRTALAVRRWRYDELAILWNDSKGTAERNVDRTALMMSGHGYLAITPGGTVVECSLLRQLRIECVRAVASIGVAMALGALLYAPAMLFRLGRSFVALAIWRPMKGRPTLFRKAGLHGPPDHAPGKAMLYARNTGR